MIKQLLFAVFLDYGSDFITQIEIEYQKIRNSSNPLCIHVNSKKAKILVNVANEEYLVILGSDTNTKSRIFANEKLFSILEELQSFRKQCDSSFHDENTIESSSVESYLIYNDPTLSFETAVPSLDGNWPYHASPVE